MLMNKLTFPLLDKKVWTNYDLIKVPKVIKPTNKRMEIKVYLIERLTDRLIEKLTGKEDM